MSEVTKRVMPFSVCFEGIETLCTDDVRFAWAHFLVMVTPTMLRRHAWIRVAPGDELIEYLRRGVFVCFTMT